MICDDFREKKICIPRAEGYWIHRQGMVITLCDNLKHIDMVIGFPSLFGLSRFFENGVKIG